MVSETPQQLISGEWQAQNADETFALGQKLGSQLSGGEIILLDGPLGAGKTIFVKGIASSLGIEPEEVTSPSFTLVNPYEARFPFFHIDLYRLDEGYAAAHAVDLQELLSDERAVIVIEWAERLGKYPLTAHLVRVKISGDGEAPRTILISTS